VERSSAVAARSSGIGSRCFAALQNFFTFRRVIGSRCFAALHALACRRRGEAKERDDDVETEMRIVEAKALDADVREAKMASAGNVKPVIDARRDEGVKVIEMKTTFITDTRDVKIETNVVEAKARLRADSIGKVNIDDDKFRRQSTVGRMPTIQASGEYERSSSIVEEYRDRIVPFNYNYRMKPHGAEEFRKWKSRLSVTGTGTLSQFLGMDYMRDREVITREVSMGQYVERTVSRFEPQGAKFAQAG